MHRYLWPTSLLMLMACPAPDPGFDIKKDEGSSDPDDTGVDDTDTSTDPDDTSEDPDDTSGGGGETGGDGEYNFEDPGDTLDFEADGSPTQLSIADEEELNQDQEFYLLLVNNSSSDQGYSLRYILDSDVGGAEQAERRILASGPNGSGPRGWRPSVEEPSTQVHYRPALESDDVGELVDTFRVRIDMEDDDSYEVKDATLWALGDHVAIWVDNEVPIDWDFDCDGEVDQAHPYPTYGFDNCDLQTVADIVDLNIYPNVVNMFGEPSDIDGDGRVDVFISPELNALPASSTDEEEQDSVLESYAEPSVDLKDYDIRTNPGSDQREVIYLYAPDPNAFFHEGVSVSLSEYINYSLAAQVARSLVALVSYNQHIEENDGTTVESDWVNNALGALAADRCGFGAPYHKDAWEYLDAPHNFPLVSDDSKGSLSTEAQGAQYLFALWLWDWAESGTSDRDAFFAAIVQNDKTGTDSFDYAISQYANDTDTKFAELVVWWQLSLLGTGATASDGSDLVDHDSFVAYSEAEFLSSPPAARDNLFGANGYQRGFNVRGTNVAVTGGDSDDPQVEEGSEIVAEGTDPFHFDPAFSFEGYIAGNYGAQLVRLNGAPYDAAGLELQYSGEGFVGMLVRWNDPETPDYEIENIYSPKDVNAVVLPSLPDDGTSIYGIGELTDPATVIVVDASGGEEESEVADTDRWLLDLTDRPDGEQVTVHVWLDRRFDVDGDSQPSDPWVAIAPASYVPEPTVEGTARGGLCPNGVEFAYPTSVLDYLYYQVFLSGTMRAVALTDYCGVPEGTLPDCDVDFDRDGVLDENEPLPSNFFEQVLVQQCTSLGGSVPADVGAYSSDWLDYDELDSDDDPTTSRVYNTGGQAGESGEEGFAAATLEGGQTYMIVVGAGSDTGIYELSVRQIIE